MSTETLLVTPPTVTTRRIAVLATVLALTSLVAIPGSLLYPEPATGDAYTLSDLRPIRDFWWAWNTILSINGVLNIPALAVAGVLLAPRRGGQWALVGAVMMWFGTALYAVGISGMATAFYVATDPVLDDAVSTGLLAGLNSDPQTYAAAIAGSVLVTLGTTTQAVGLLRARTIPRWVPWMSLAIWLSYVVPTNAGVIGLVVEVPITLAALAIAWFLVRSQSRL